MTESTPHAEAATIRILAIGSLKAPLSADQKRRLLRPKELPETVRLYVSGKIDQWFSRQDELGVVFLVNADSLDSARDMLEALPLSRAGLMTFELIALGPLSPLAMLLRQSHT